jgi:hypothetical protein
MSTPPPAVHIIVQHLLARESSGAESSSGDLAQAIRACDKLRVPLSKLAGAAGFSSLLSRALALAKRQVPSLDELSVEVNGTLGGFKEADHAMAPLQTSRQGGAILLTELIGLLVKLIGEALTLHLLGEVWPDVSSETITSSTEDES